VIVGSVTPVNEREATVACGEWVALSGRGTTVPAGVLGQIQSEIPDGSQWAIAADARTFWALGPDDVLRALTITSGNEISSTSHDLRGCRIVARHTTGLVEDYQETETRQVHQWTFSVDGAPLLTLVGTVYSERGRPRDRPDRRQMLALALHDLAGRSDA
jgi:hypothetical protein